MGIGATDTADSIPEGRTVPYNMQRFLILRIEPNNREAIDFALDQLLSSPAHSANTEVKKSFQSTGLGVDAHTLLARVNESLSTGDYQGLEKVISTPSNVREPMSSLRPLNGTKAQTLQCGRTYLSLSSAIPSLLKRSFASMTKKSANRIFQQLDSFRGASATRWAVLIYGEGPEPRIDSGRIVRQIS
jgi:hypothetical protein